MCDGGEGGLNELKERLQEKDQSTLFILLRCDVYDNNGSSPQFTGVNFVFGRFVGSRVESRRKHALYEKRAEFADQFQVKHLSQDADEAMSKWTAKEMGNELMKQSLAAKGAKLLYDFGPGAVYQTSEHSGALSSNWRDLHWQGLNSDDWQGFKSNDEALEFGRQYFKDILSAGGVDSLRKRADMYFDGNAQFVGNGCVLEGVDAWLQMQEDFRTKCEPVRSVLKNFALKSFGRYMFVAKFVVCIKFADGQELTNQGRVMAEMSELTRKMTHIVETSTPQSIGSIQRRYKESIERRPFDC